MLSASNTFDARASVGSPCAAEEDSIRVHAASLNYRDLLVALGQMSSRISDIHLPLVPLSDCAGK